jgi:hypothetical protein
MGEYLGALQSTLNIRPAPKADIAHNLAPSPGHRAPFPLTRLIARFDDERLSRHRAN